MRSSGLRIILFMMFYISIFIAGCSSASSVSNGTECYYKWDCPSGQMCTDGFCVKENTDTIVTATDQNDSDKLKTDIDTQLADTDLFTESTPGETDMLFTDTDTADQDVKTDGTIDGDTASQPDTADKDTASTDTTDSDNTILPDNTDTAASQPDADTVPVTRTFNCPAKPANTIWNTVSSYTQTWNGSSWLPADTATEYNTTASTSACRYICDTAGLYNWDVSISKCTKCGDNTKEGAEVCDGTALDSKTCPLLFPAANVTFNYTGAVATWTVPASGIYTIEVSGAQGGAGSGGDGGLGARMKGSFTLAAGDVLKILAGGAGTAGTNGGGGGGSYVTDSSNNPYIIAGGGGGGYHSTNSAGAGNMAGTTGTKGMDGYNGSTGAVAGLGGTGPNGGTTSTEYTSDGSGGGGLTGNGEDGVPSTGGKSFVNGGAGGIGADIGDGFTGGPGGFGGGGGGDFLNWTGGGGGGGYGGGGGGAYYGCGGGGGSYNGGTNQSNSAGVQSGNGTITISWGFTGGILSCSADCKSFNTSQCL